MVMHVFSSKVEDCLNFDNFCHSLGNVTYQQAPTPTPPVYPALSNPAPQFQQQVPATTPTVNPQQLVQVE